jgi:ABC-type nitrate/sulfonate/bicarbonate transport system permease component
LVAEVEIEVLRASLSDALRMTALGVAIGAALGVVVSVALGVAIRVARGLFMVIHL